MAVVSYSSVSPKLGRRLTSTHSSRNSSREDPLQPRARADGSSVYPLSVEDPSSGTGIDRRSHRLVSGRMFEVMLTLVSPRKTVLAASQLQEESGSSHSSAILFQR